jgi:hypothetical protein
MQAQVILVLFGEFSDAESEEFQVIHDTGCFWTATWLGQ